jgi:translation initiation factor 5B
MQFYLIGGWLICLLFVLFQIVGTNSEEQQKMFGRHFELEDELVSHISRKSIDLLKTNYKVGD